LHSGLPRCRFISESGAFMIHTAEPVSPQVATALRHGVIAAQARDFDRARPLLQHVTERMPDDVIAWYWLAIASPSAEAAIPCLRRVLSIDNAHGQARDALSRLLIAEARTAASAGRRDEARALAAEATDLSPDSPSMWRALAELATCQVDRIDALRRMTHLSPEDAGIRTQFRQALMARAVIIARSNRVEARARFQEVAALNPADTRVWQALSNLADTTGERAKYLRELLRVAPDHQQARGNLRKLLVDDARELQEAGELEESRGRWREALDVAGSDIELWLGFAQACDDPVEQTRAIHAAQELDSHDPRVLEALALLSGMRIDPGALPDPDEAFARFDASPAPSDNAMVAEPIDDAMFNALAQLPAFTTDATDPTPLETGAAPDAIDFTPLVSDVPLDTIVADIDITTRMLAATPADTVIATDEVEVAAEATPHSEGIELAEPPALEAPPEQPAVSSAASDASPVVMVVDDSPTIRKILGLTLERAGFTVVVEPNGLSALTRLESVVPNVILLDIAMPDLDGYEVCKRIKQDPRTTNVPVIMLSGKGAFFDKVKGHLAGATEYLTKPFETPVVLEVVANHCQAAAEVHRG
jgi:twitching motility two-component system response regulator PilG